MDAKEAFRLQKENNFVILDVRPEAEFKEVSLDTHVYLTYSNSKPVAMVSEVTHNPASIEHSKLVVLSDYCLLPPIKPVLLSCFKLSYVLGLGASTRCN